MLAKWWWRFTTKNNSLWCNVIKSIHGPHGGLHDASSIRCKAGPWYQIAILNGELNDIGINLHSIFKVKIGNGQSTRFWGDIWVGNSPLSDKFPRLLRIETNPNCRVCDRVPSTVPLSVDTSLRTGNNTLSNCIFHSSIGHALNQPGINLDSNEVGPDISHVGKINPLGLQFHWQWRRPLRSQDVAELEELQSLLSNFHNLSIKMVGTA